MRRACSRVNWKKCYSVGSLVGGLAIQEVVAADATSKGGIAALRVASRGYFASNTTFPPTTVVRTVARSIASGGIRVKSWSSSTMSAL